MWLPYKNSQNHIKVMREPHMKHNVTQLEGNNEPINFSSSFLGNYFLELYPGNYQSKEANCESDTQYELLHFSWTDDIDCNIVNLVSNIESNINLVDLEDIFCLFFILTDPKQKRDQE